MAIRTYEKDGQKFFEVYVNSSSGGVKRVQFKKRGIVTIREARNVEFEFKRTISNRNERTSYTWEEWHQHCVEQMQLEMRPSTILSYDLALKKWAHPVWRDMDIRTITSRNVYDLIYKDLEHFKPNGRRNILKMIKRLFNMAIEEGILERNPAVKVKVRVPEIKQAVLTSAEANILLKEAKALSHEFYEIWAMALLTGMRSGELYALKWTDVDFENRRIFITRSWCNKGGFGPTKSSRNRVIPISRELERLLKELKVKSKPDYEFVLPHLWKWEKGEQAAVTRQFCLSIGITSVKFHDLRASFITQLLLKGVPLAQVMSMVGHADLKTTNVYLRVIGSDLDGATDKLSISLPKDELARVIDINVNGGG